MPLETAKYITLGCKLNFAETSAIARQLQAMGIKNAEPGSQADICIVNTCTVTDLADKKCRQAIRKARKENPDARIVVTGCYAQLKPEEIARMDGVDLVLGAENKLDLVNYLDSLNLNAPARIITTPVREIKTFLPSCSYDMRTRHFLKVQDGCNYCCSYCTIPFARGRSRNAPIAQIVRQAEEVARNGGKEIILTGVNIGDFGRSTGEDFYSLIKALDGVEGIERYRISSIEPNLLTDEMIAFVAQSHRFAPHFHLPLQSGCDEVLKLMRRRYDTVLFKQRVEGIKKALPNAFIGVDVISGMRGEKEEYFQQTQQFIDALPVSQLHVFAYSDRPGAAATNIPHAVSNSDKHRRSRSLTDLSNAKLQTFYQSQQGRQCTVLFEHARHGNVMYGFTENYVKTVAPYNDSLVNIPLQITVGDWNAEYNAADCHFSDSIRIGKDNNRTEFQKIT